MSDVPGATVITELLGGGDLARAMIDGATPAGWHGPRPAGPDEWRRRARAIGEAHDARWLDRLGTAIAARGPAADRLTRVAAAGGVVVTTGQQPGLFGGPVYTWSKALTALTLADAIEAATGVPAAPVFWAATDDSDFAEASWTAIALPGGYERLALDGAGDGTSMSAVPLGDMSRQLQSLMRAAGSALDQRPLAAAAASYRPGQTVGGAYLDLLARLLGPLGIAVLDASEAAVSTAAHPLLERALERAAAIDHALRARDVDIRAHGWEPQVAEVDGLTLVFRREEGKRRRIAARDAADEARRTRPGDLLPNVLLRPVVERYLLPTVAYAAGPGELSYFAQVGAVAAALEADEPMAVPRWSATIVEPHVRTLLERHGLAREDLASLDALSARLARQAIPRDLQDEVDGVRSDLGTRVANIRAAIDRSGGLVPPRTLEAVERGVDWRLGRFERRLGAAVRRREQQLMMELATMAGSLFPGGVRQERALNLLPLWARYGNTLIDQMLAHASAHATGLVRGGPRAEEPAASLDAASAK